MTEIRSICVYCGSGHGKREAYTRAARRFGALVGEAGIGLVYGGGNIGLMGETAKATLAAGGHVTGIIPEFLKRRERMLEAAQETLIVPDMHTRKQAMFERADAFVALPGGIGTLEELVEQLTWAQLGQHRKPILLLDVEGFWRPLLSLFAHMREAGFIREGLELSYLVAEKVEDVIPMLRRAAQRAGDDEGAEQRIVEHF